MEDFNGEDFRETPELPLEVSCCFAQERINVKLAHTSSLLTETEWELPVKPQWQPTAGAWARVITHCCCQSVICNQLHSVLSFELIKWWGGCSPPKSITMMWSNVVFLSLAVDHSSHPELSSRLRQEGSLSGLPQLVLCQSRPPLSGNLPHGGNLLHIMTLWTARVCNLQGRVDPIFPLSAPVCAEGHHLPLPSLSLVPGADQGSGQKTPLQPDYQPARWLQFIQITASWGALCCWVTWVYMSGDS